MAGIKKQITSTIFVGQSDIVVFDEVDDYDTATFQSVTAAGESVGQVSGDSSEYVGEDATTENWVDEKGNIITSTTTAGTVAIKFNMANMSAANVKKFLNGVGLENLESTLLQNVKNAVGFAVDLPVMTRPLGWFNDEANRCLFMPKAKMVASLGYDTKRFTINVTATAGFIDSETLKTAMLFDAKPVYEGDAAA